MRSSIRTHMKSRLTSVKSLSTSVLAIAREKKPTGRAKKNQSKLPHRPIASQISSYRTRSPKAKSRSSSQRPSATKRASSTLLSKRRSPRIAREMAHRPSTTKMRIVSTWTTQRSRSLANWSSPLQPTLIKLRASASN